MNIAISKMNKTGSVLCFEKLSGEEGKHGIYKIFNVYGGIDKKR